MTAPEERPFDPRHDAESIFGAPESPDESARARDLAELFGPLMQDDESGDADDSASREHLAALFGAQSAAATASAEAEPDFTWQPEQVGSAAPRAWAPERDGAPEEAAVRDGGMAEQTAAEESLATAGQPAATGLAAERSPAAGALPDAAEEKPLPAAQGLPDAGAEARAFEEQPLSETQGFSAAGAETRAFEAQPLSAAQGLSVAGAGTQAFEESPPPTAQEYPGAGAETRAFEEQPLSAAQGLSAAGAETRAFKENPVVAAGEPGAPEPTSAEPFAPEPATRHAGSAAFAGGAAAASTTRSSGADTESDADLESEDPLAWLDRMEERSVDTPEKAALGSWLGNASAPAPTSPSAVAAAALAAPTKVLPPAPTGSFSPAPRRGIRAWSSKVRWSVAVSIVLLIGVVAASVLIAQNVAANNIAAQELAAAVAELEAAEASATQPESLLDDAFAEYEDTVDIAQATADNAAPPLAAVAGMASQPLLDASNGALAALVAQLAASSIGDLPEPYERGDVDLTEIDAVKAATTTAEEHATLVTTATREVRAAQAALQEKLEALRVAQVALGASLPEAAVLIVEENRRALQSFKDAVIATAAAVPTAQSAGGSGDAELLAYAAAVTALREDQVRAQTGVTPVTPANPAPLPEPTTDPAPAPDPAPPQPTPTPVPTPEPSPTETVVPPETPVP